MNQLSPFIYQSSYGLEWLVLGILFALLVSPRHLVTFVVILIFLRPDERFPLSFPVLSVSYMFLAINLILNYRRVATHRFQRDDKVVLAFVGLVLLETAMFNRGNLGSLLQDFGLCLLFYFSMVVFLNDRRGFGLLARSLLLSTALICVEPLYYHFTEPTGSIILQRFSGHEGRVAAWGLWRNANETSFLAILGVSAISLRLTAGNFRFARLFRYIPLLIMFLLITVMTASRTGIVCMLLLFTAVGFFSKQYSFKVAAVGLLIVGITLAPKYLATRTDMQGSAEDRADLRYIGKQLFTAHPIFGVGFGEARYGYGTKGAPLHNTFLQAFAETGFLGGLLIVYFFFLNGKELVRRIWSKTVDPGQRMRVGVLFGFLVSATIYMFFGNQLLSIMFFTVFGVIKAGTHDPRISNVDLATKEQQAPLAV
jgi:O-antigen ligase